MSKVINAYVGIMAIEAAEAIKAAETLEDKFKAAFAVAKDHWMVTDEEEQFQAGIGAVLMNINQDSEDSKRIHSELKMLRTLNAATSGIPVNFNALDTDDFEPIGLIGIWKNR